MPAPITAKSYDIFLLGDLSQVSLLASDVSTARFERKETKVLKKNNN